MNRQGKPEFGRTPLNPVPIQTQTNKQSHENTRHDSPIDHLLRLNLFARHLADQTKSMISTGIASIYRQSQPIVKDRPKLNDDRESVVDHLSTSKIIRRKSLHGLQKETDRNRETVTSLNRDHRDSRSRQQFMNPISTLQQKYSKYMFKTLLDRMTREERSVWLPRNSNRSELLLVARNIQPTRLTSDKKNQFSNNHLNRMRDGSIDLPLVSQLGAMLTRHATRMTGTMAATIPTFSQQSSLTGPITRQTTIWRNPLVNQYTAKSSGSSTNNLQSRDKINAGFSPSGVHERARGIIDKPSNGRAVSEKQKTTNEFISQHKLRKAIEQIFQEELKRYGM
jgi:hypothetical protein